MSKVTYNANAVIIEKRKLLTGRDKGYRLYKLPGGGIEIGETAEEALVRELREELGIVVFNKDFALLGEFVGQRDRKTLRGTKVFLVKTYEGIINPHGEVEELSWVDSNSEDLRLEWILKHKVIPYLLKENLID